MTRKLLLTAALAAGALIATANPAPAHADGVRVRVGGNVNVRVGGPRVHWRVGAPRWRHYHRPAPYRVRVGGAVWVGGGVYWNRWAAPPPPMPPAVCDCGPSVPAYYPPVAPAPATYYVAPVAPAPEQPRLGIGVFAGGVDVEGDGSGDDVGLLARLRLTGGLYAEAELAKTELHDGDRLDRRLGGALLYEINSHNTWAPYLVGGLGVVQNDINDDTYESEQSYAEIGGGLRWRISRHFSLAGDLRVGSRALIEDEDDVAIQPAARVVAPPQDENEDYTRGRISAIVYF